MTQGENIIEDSAELDNWSRVIVMRYPSRRAVLELFANPAYAPLEPYKMTALQVVSCRRRVTGDSGTALAGGRVLLLLFFLIGWLRAARQH
jgi:hypothetical protein